MLIGRAGAAPEMRSTAAGKIVSFSLAVSETYKDKNGEKKENTEWSRLVFFGKLADIAEKYITKGTLLYVEGKLKTSSYEKDGSKHYSTDIIVNEMRMLSSKDGSKPASEADDDLPF